MLEFQIEASIRDKKEWSEHEYQTTKAVSDYFSFITTLNQFGRLLKKYDITLPNLKRIRFYRNKVAEHWDDYTETAHTGSLTQIKGKPAVPSISSIYLPDERKQLMLKLKLLFKERAVDFDIENPEVSNIADQPENIEKIYGALEQIDPALQREIIPAEIISALFEFGFPSPIHDVESYARTLVEELKKELKIHKGPTFVEVK